MVTASEKMIQAIEAVVKPVSIGTNKALFDLLWAMVAGLFLVSRGAMHSALKASGCTDAEIRRGSNALRAGQWLPNELVSNWQRYVQTETNWQRRTYEGWLAVVCDVVVFPRAKLQGWKGKLYRGTFGKAVKAIGVGVIVDIGEYERERVPLLRHLLFSRNEAGSESKLQKEMLSWVAKKLAPKEVFVHDAGLSVQAVQAANIDRFVIRLAKNCVARRNQLPDNAHGNRQYGEVVRPLSRTRQGKQIVSTNDADETVAFQHQGRTIEAQCWRDVVGYDAKVADAAATYDIWVFLTRCFGNRFWLAQRSKHLGQRFSSFIWIVGLWSNCPWRPSKWLGCTATMFSAKQVVNVYQPWRYWRAIC